MGPSTPQSATEGAADRLLYILLLQDDLSSFVNLVPAVAADSATMAAAFTKWGIDYSFPEFLVTDQGTHFKNHMMKESCERLGVQHHFTTAAQHWSNGSVERAGASMRSVFRTILSEFRLLPSSWPAIVMMVQFVINHTPKQSLGNFALIQVFLGRNPCRLLII
jgi:IS30 family transposase